MRPMDPGTREMATAGAAPRGATASAAPGGAAAVHGVGIMSCTGGRPVVVAVGVAAGVDVGVVMGLAGGKRAGIGATWRWS